MGSSCSSPESGARRSCRREFPYSKGGKKYASYRRKQHNLYRDAKEFSNFDWHKAKKKIKKQRLQVNDQNQLEGYKGYRNWMAELRQEQVDLQKFLDQRKQQEAQIGRICIAVK